MTDRPISETLLEDARARISDAYYDTRNQGGTPDAAADLVVENLKPILQSVDANAHQRGQQAALQEMQAEVSEVNTANGWFDARRSFSDGIALLHSEVSEAFEAYRDHGLADFTKADGIQTLAKPEGVGSEYADVLIRLLDSCEREGINLRAEYERKITYNRTRGYRHGGKRL